MDAIVARYEWRAWADRLDDVERRMRELSERHGTRDSAETYVMSTAATDVNPKVRDDVLDVKVLVEVRDGYERWEPRLKEAFPLPAEVVRTGLFGLLGVAPPPLDLDRYSPADLFEVVGRHDAVTAVAVTKRRHAFTLEGCIAEVADVTIAGVTRQTACLESADLAALRNASLLAGLDRYDNISYPTMIRGIVALGTG